MSDTLEMKRLLLPRHLVAGLHAFALAAVMVFGATPALAQKAAGPLETRMEQRKVVAADGRERFEGAEAVKPGDVIEYVATYRNTGKDAITGLVATLPVPAETEYLPGSARPAGATASVDGVRFEAIPLKRKARSADGKEIEQLVPYREYRALRWNAGELGAQKSVAYTARVKVVDDAPAAPRAVAK
jgi:uncharacterized repeat protein (TIGR01451 family)